MMRSGFLIEEDGMMKRIAVFLMTMTMVMPAVAQLGDDGFYRIQNAKSKWFATVVDNKAENKDVTSTTNIDLYAINTREADNVMSDPGSVFYIERKGTNDYILRAQGMDTYELTNMYLKTSSSNEIAGAYYLYGRDNSSSMTRLLKEDYNTSFNFYYVATTTLAGRSDESCSWNIIPVTDAEGQYIGVEADIEVDGKYYSTLYTSFAYRLSKGMKAYYIRQCNGQMAEMMEIGGNAVPEKTPVIIECSSNKAADNRITPLKDNQDGIVQNQLNGVFFRNVLKWSDKTEATGHPNWNATNYDATTMRVLGMVNGKLAFVKDEDLDYLPANKAYLMVNSSAAANIELVGTDKYPSGINDLKTEKNTSKKSIYSLTGEKVSRENVPTGVYVIDGKKTIIRR